VKHTEHNANPTVTSKTGPLATLRALLNVKGIAAQKITLLLAVYLASTALPAGAQAAACPNEQFRTGFSAALPDCRAYEMVTPPHKNGNPPKDIYLSGEGNSLAAIAASAWSDNVSGTNEAHNGAAYYLGRTAAGWAATPVNLPLSEYETFLGALNPVATGFGGGETLSVERARSLPSNEIDIYRVPSPGAPPQDMGPLTPPDVPQNEGVSGVLENGQLAVVGYSADLTHVVLNAGYTQQGGDQEGPQYTWPLDEPADGPLLYEYVGTENGGETRAPVLVPVSGGDGSTHLISQCGAVLGNGYVVEPTDLDALSHEGRQSAVSADGRTVVFTARPEGVKTGGYFSVCRGRGPAVNELYARVEPSAGQYETVAISEPTKAACVECDLEAAELVKPERTSARQRFENNEITSREFGEISEGFNAQTEGLNARFVAVSADGSRVFFETEQPLLGGDSSDNIYEYDLDSPEGHRVVRVSGGDATVSDPTAEAMRGSVTVSEDGSHVYFAARGVLTQTPNEFGQAAQPGAENLYVFDTQTDSTTFIALGYVGGAETTPDGRFAIFASSAQHVTPDDTSSGQLFEYDALSGELARISIGQDGYNDDGNSDVFGYSFVDKSMSDDGSYVFFTSENRLTPQAQAGVGNIYEYHSAGRIGAGTVSLISDGHELSFFEGGQFSGRLLGTDASGDDVYFTTVDPLVPQDTDTQEDIYDARVDGGFPPPPVLDECAGEECQGSLSPAPVLLAPGSAFQAGGNPPLAAPAPAVAEKKAAKCHKGFVKNKQGRCVKSNKKKTKARKASNDRRVGR
jgi:hypothetical protein